MSTSQEAKLLSKMSVYQMVATIEAMERAGMTEELFKLLRSDAKAVRQLAIYANRYLSKQCRAEAAIVEELSGISVELSKLLNPDRFFGPEDWLFHFGQLEFLGHDLPGQFDILAKVLNSFCPFVPGKKVKDTHYLYYLPPDFNDKLLTISQWQAMFPADGQARFYNYLNDEVWYKDYNFITTNTARFSWYLMFEGVIPDSLNLTWEEQLLLKPDNYEVPKLIEVVPIHFLIYKKNHGQRLNSQVYGRTIDTDSDGKQIYCGEFGPEGLGIRNHYWFGPGKLENLGLFLFRKL